jgi:hypothetical protein
MFVLVWIIDLNEHAGWDADYTETKTQIKAEEHKGLSRSATSTVLKVMQPEIDFDSNLLPTKTVEPIKSSLVSANQPNSKPNKYSNLNVSFEDMKTVVRSEEPKPVVSQVSNRVLPTALSVTPSVYNERPAPPQTVYQAPPANVLHQPPPATATTASLPVNQASAVPNHTANANTTQPPQQPYANPPPQYPSYPPYAPYSGYQHPPLPAPAQNPPYPPYPPHYQQPYPYMYPPMPYPAYPYPPYHHMPMGYSGIDPYNPYEMPKGHSVAGRSSLNQLVGNQPIVMELLQELQSAQVRSWSFELFS